MNKKKSLHKSPDPARKETHALTPGGKGKVAGRGKILTGNKIQGGGRGKVTCTRRIGERGKIHRGVIKNSRPRTQQQVQTVKE